MTLVVNNLAFSSATQIVQLTNYPANGVDIQGWAGITGRFIFLPAGLATTRFTTDKTRVVVRAGTEGLAVNKMYIGHRAGAGDIWDFSTTPVQLTFNGSATFTVGASSYLFTDWADFVWDQSSGIIVSFFILGASTAVDTTMQTNASANQETHFISGDDAATVNATGYTLAGNDQAFEIQVRRK